MRNRWVRNWGYWTLLCFVSSIQNPTFAQVLSLKTLPVQFDASYGAAIARIGNGTHGEGRLHQMDATLVELEPGGKLEPHKHLAEEIIYIVSGKGYTTIWETGKKQSQKRYDWQAGDALSPSLNNWHEHGNASATESARFLSVTSTPLTNNLFGDGNFVTSSTFTFQDRWERGTSQPKPEYQPGEWNGDSDEMLMAVGHHFPDLIGVDMVKHPDPGSHEAGLNIRPTGSEGPGMAGNRLFEWQNREWLVPGGATHYHRHPWEVVYLCIKGEMHSKLTRMRDRANETLEPERTLTWKAGDLIIVEADEYHSHVSEVVGTRFLQFKVSGYFRRVGIDAGLMGPNLEDRH